MVNSKKYLVIFFNRMAPKSSAEMLRVFQWIETHFRGLTREEEEKRKKKEEEEEKKKESKHQKIFLEDILFGPYRDVSHSILLRLSATDFASLRRVSKSFRTSIVRLVRSDKVIQDSFRTSRFFNWRLEQFNQKSLPYQAQAYAFSRRFIVVLTPDRKVAVFSSRNFLLLYYSHLGVYSDGDAIWLPKIHNNVLYLDAYHRSYQASGHPLLTLDLVTRKWTVLPPQNGLT